MIVYTVMMKYVIGIDEVGRGPIAGPVVVCACAVMDGVNTVLLFPKGILKDSKKLSEKVRNEIASKIEELVVDKKVQYGIGEVSAMRIDEIGINPSIREAMERALAMLHTQGVPETSFVYLDGSLHAPRKYQQETIIKGDEKIVEIALASIIAKVYRDTLMKNIASEFPNYGFEKHVGYGTKAHYEALTRYGMTEHHRRSFLKRIQDF